MLKDLKQSLFFSLCIGWCPEHCPESMQTAWLLLELEIREPGVPLGPWASSGLNGDPLEKRPAALPHRCLWAGCTASILRLHVPCCSESVLIPAPSHLYSADSERKLLSLASLWLVLAVMATPVWWSVFPPRAVVPLKAIQRYRDTLLNISAAHIFCITANSISIDLWAREITRQWFLLLRVAYRSFPVLQGTASIYSSCITLTCALYAAYKASVWSASLLLFHTNLPSYLYWSHSYKKYKALLHQQPTFLWLASH